ncbi:MAG: hypothetical protein QOH59_2606 [Gemmatimonadales bacterium]|jgi:hypothetical protein|nr:hypothetical protein [Gemmatimonadales bacterium]
MNQLQRGFVLAGCSALLAACSSELSVPTDSSGVTAAAAAESTSALAVGSLRVRCERRSGRSKISVDGNNLSPRNGLFSARVRAAGGTVASTSRRAVGDEVEFDFDSNRNDIAAGATRLSANFVVRRAGADVIGEILNAQGVVVASRGAECEIR